MRRQSHNERRVRALGDRGLVDAMRAGDSFAFGEFLARFRPVLLDYAERRIPSERIPECVDDALEDEALRLSEPDSHVPTQMIPYLIGAVRHRHLMVMRSSDRRQRRHEEASEMVGAAGAVTHVVTSVCGESAIAASRGAAEVDVEAPSALQQFVRALDAELDDESRRILEWVSRAIPHRQIAEWLDQSYEATTKRIWRLCRRLERAAPTYVAMLSPEAQRELDRFFRRAGRGRRET